MQGEVSGPLDVLRNDMIMSRGEIHNNVSSAHGLTPGTVLLPRESVSRRVYLRLEDDADDEACPKSGVIAGSEERSRVGEAEGLPNLVLFMEERAELGRGSYQSIEDLTPRSDGDHGYTDPDEAFLQFLTDFESIDIRAVPITPKFSKDEIGRGDNDDDSEADKMDVDVPEVFVESPKEIVTHSEYGIGGTVIGTNPTHGRTYSEEIRGVRSTHVFGANASAGRVRA